MNRLICFFLGHKIMIKTICGAPYGAFCWRCGFKDVNAEERAFAAWKFYHKKGRGRV